MKIRSMMLFVVLTLAVSARADLFSTYTSTGNTFTVPTSAYDASGGLLHYLSGNTLYRQDGFNVNSFTAVGHLGSGFSVNDFPAFVEFSPDGSRVAIGNSGGADFSTYQIAVFDASLLNASNPDLSASASVYAVNHSSAVWANSTELFMTAGVFGSPGVVTRLDTTSPTGSPVNPTLVNNIGGASGGVALDANNNLFTGNGFVGSGPSGTGWIKAVRATAWQGSPPVDFENSSNSVFTADLLSANSLGFDSEGNLLVGGGDFGGDINYFALISAGALGDLLNNGTPIDINDPLKVRKFDPSTGGFSYYTLAIDRDNNCFYALDGTTAFQFCPVPEPSQWAMLLIGGMLVAWRLRRGRNLALFGAGLLIVAAGPSEASNFFAEEVTNFSAGAGASLETDLPFLLGGPLGLGPDQGNTTDIYKLGEAGSVTLGFNQKWIEDGAGADFIVFENAFVVGGNPNSVFGELFFVEVSTDGTNFARFDSLSLNTPVGSFGTMNPNLVSGLGGTGPVLANVNTNLIDPFNAATAGGNAFDLASLSGHALVQSGAVNLNQIRYLRLVDIVGDGTTLDTSGNPIYDPTGFSQSADIDAVSVIHGIPEPGSGALCAIGLVLLALQLRKQKLWRRTI